MTQTLSPDPSQSAVLEQIFQGLLDPKSVTKEVLTMTLFLWIRAQLDAEELREFDALCESKAEAGEIMAFAAAHIQDFAELAEEVLLMKIAELEAKVVDGANQATV